MLIQQRMDLEKREIKMDFNKCKICKKDVHISEYCLNCADYLKYNKPVLPDDARKKIIDFIVESDNGNRTYINLVVLKSIFKDIRTESEVKKEERVRILKIIDECDETSDCVSCFISDVKKKLSEHGEENRW